MRFILKVNSIRDISIHETLWSLVDLPLYKSTDNFSFLSTVNKKTVSNNGENRITFIPSNIIYRQRLPYIVFPIVTQRKKNGKLRLCFGGSGLSK